MNYKRGDVVLVPFPFTDLTTTKKRPALVISADHYNRSQVNLIVAAISSQVTKSEVGDCLIQHWQAAGLLKPSQVKATISTIEQNMVMRKLGTLNLNDLKAVEQSLADVLGFVLSHVKPTDSAPSAKDLIRTKASPPPESSRRHGERSKRCSSLH